MSHCTSFPFAYTEERHIINALQRMDLKPEYDVVSEYSSDLTKKLSFFGYLGRKQYRAVCAKHGEGNIMIIRDKGIFRFMIESSNGDVPYKVASNIESFFRSHYIASVLEEICDDFKARGINAELLNKGNVFHIYLGPDRSISITIEASASSIQESVAGAKGNVCEAITSQIEAMLAAPNSTISSEWKTEYYEQIDNKLIQILNLHQ